MKKEHFQIQGIPSIVWGEPSGNLYLFIHGQGGCKEEAESFAKIADCYGWQVLSLDLSGHGERKEEQNTFDPWHIVGRNFIWGKRQPYGIWHGGELCKTFRVQPDCHGKWRTLVSYTGTTGVLG